MKEASVYTVYMHRFPNNKVYIGITKRDVYTRWSNGKNYNRYFVNAVNKYGWDNVEHIILADNLTKENACKMEIDLIAKYKSNQSRYGYNITSGGDGRPDFVLSDDARRRIGEATRNRTKGTHISDEQKQKISKALKGRKLSEERRQFLSNINKGRVSPNRGKKMSDEQRRKISFARKGFKMSNEQKIKLSNINKGKKLSEQTKKLKSDKMKGMIHINNGIIGKRIKIDELDEYMSKGFVRGQLTK